MVCMVKYLVQALVFIMIAITLSGVQTGFQFSQSPCVDGLSASSVRMAEVPPGQFKQTPQ